MKYLTIIRHAKSSWEQPDLDDIARPLNERGKNAIKIIGKHLQENHLQADLIISSPAIRAHETAKGISEWLLYDEKKLLLEPVVYFGTSSAIIEMLKKINDRHTDVFLFGHEPILSSLIFQLTKTTLEKFPTCSVFRIAFKADSWSAIKTGNKELFVYPKLLTE